VPLVPDGSDDDVIARGAIELLATAIEVLAVVVCTGLLESVTVTTKLLEAALEVGVPEMVPVDAESESPAGNWPEVTDQVYGVVPPLAWTV